MESHFVGVICGLKSEARIVARSLDRSKARIGVSGANARYAEKLAAKYCEGGASAIISVGLAGGLDPQLKPGDLVIGDIVVGDDGGRYESDRYLLGSLRREAAAHHAITGAIFGSDEIIDSEEKKAALYHNHGAIAVDMESHGAARAAKNADVPFVVIRAIADPAHRVVPEAATNAIAPDGSTKIFTTLFSILRKPKEAPQVVELGRDSDKAFRCLRRDLGFLFRALFLSLDL